MARFRRFAMAMGLSAGSGFTDRASDGFCNWTRDAGAPEDREGHPMNCVTWQTAMDFCRWDTSSGTLPSEAQWEYAARGSMNRPWPWEGPDGPMPDGRVCWNRYLPTPLGTCLEEEMTYAAGATSEGVRHLVGNVWEWTVDLHASFDDTTCWGGAARTNPVCMNNASGYRSIRGGSWNDSFNRTVSSGARDDRPSAFRYIYVGFRCAGTAR